jgi:hypothetical protein
VIEILDFLAEGQLLVVPQVRLKVRAVIVAIL